ncbi:two-component system, OmpR family, copper resistance phosphate regulon response regulator CusR [Sarotherodon galilaeus]
MTTSSEHEGRCAPVVEASVWLRPEHPGNVSDPRQPHEDEPGGSHDLHLHLELQVLWLARRSPDGVHEGRALKQILKGPAGCSSP